VGPLGPRAGEEKRGRLRAAADLDGRRIAIHFRWVHWYGATGAGSLPEFQARPLGPAVFAENDWRHDWVDSSRRFSSGVPAGLAAIRAHRAKGPASDVQSQPAHEAVIFCEFFWRLAPR